MDKRLRTQSCKHSLDLGLSAVGNSPQEEFTKLQGRVNRTGIWGIFGNPSYGFVHGPFSKDNFRKNYIIFNFQVLTTSFFFLINYFHFLLIFLITISHLLKSLPSFYNYLTLFPYPHQHGYK